ncbi:CopG family ribbon-helix-helix protein [Sedimentitalea todarodis]|uniref:Ribbon-helix-helix domain-containing protein n=1 Tax=Sedimentitalea todarodis TaxID=1631240 RepID=A0ABU3VM31_9RHOB|nr:ribbon-helix-helix domain-containing protein [Sedimentitalea todarodis]MDU9007235.1 ribbon-helix-helix domain-containing protein [Sedimentitalea todarodis]
MHQHNKHFGIMATTSFTTRIDSELKSQLDRIARFEDRSASYMANQAIRAFVEERLATRDLLETGLALVDQGAPSLAPNAVHDWLKADDDRSFPKHDG